MSAVLLDLRFAFRMLVWSRGLTAAALLTLGLGIGAGTAVFSVVNAVLIRPLPYPHPERLVRLFQNVQHLGLRQMSVSAPEFVDYRDQSRVFEGIAIFQYQIFNRTGVDEPEQVQGATVSEGFFPLFGVTPRWGRSFQPEDYQAGSERVVMLSADFWRRRFGADSGVIGQALLLNGSRFAVVGILPPDFRFPIQGRPVELWVPAIFDAEEMGRRNTRNFMVYARLRAGIDLRQAQEDVNRVVRGFQGSVSGLGVYLVPLHEQVTGSSRPALLTLLGAVGFVLLIACANVTNLLLARAATRRRETAIRTALGAGRARLILQFLTESALLGLLGGAAGLLLAIWCLDLILAVSPSNIPRVAETGIDYRVLAFAAAVSLLSGLLAGLAPALNASRISVNETLKEEGIGATVAGRARQIRGLLVLAEVALALVLLTAAGLTIRSLLRLISTDPGFDPRNIMTMVIDLPRTKYPGKAERVSFFRETLHAVTTLPGVSSAGIVNALPFSGTNADAGFTIIGRPLHQRGELLSADWRLVSPGYFQCMGIPLLRGRYFSQVDHEVSEGVVIVNATMARRLWPAEDALGKQIKLGSEQSENPVLTVIGVVADVRHSVLDEQSKMAFYQPYTQAPQISVAFFRFPPMTLVVRAPGNQENLVTDVRKAIWAIDKDQPVSRVRMLEELVDDSLSRHRFSASLLGIFAALALILAAVGTYSVMSFAVAGRTREIGVRMALGARPGDVLLLVLREGARLALLGVAVGLAGSFTATRVLAGRLGEVGETDLATLLGMPLFLLLVSIAACYLPARRATRVDPLIALRHNLHMPWRTPSRRISVQSRRAPTAFRASVDERKILAGLAHVARGAATLEAMLSRLVEEISGTLGVSSVALFVEEEGSGDFVCRVWRQSSGPAQVPCAGAVRPPALARDSFVSRRLKKLSIPLRVGPEEFETWRLALAEGDPAVREARQLEIETLQQVDSDTLLPIALSGRLTGVLSLGKKDGGGSFSPEDSPLLMGIAGPAAYVLENVRLAKRVVEEESLRRELELASDVQRRLFPATSPQTDSFELSGYCHPARGVGGDYYDFIDLAEGCVGIALADVAGKGISAALLMSVVQASLRSRADTESLSDLVSSMNRLLHRSTSPGSYATFFYARFDPRARTLAYVNAGHLPPLMLRARDGEVTLRRLESGGPVIGMFPELTYERDTIELARGDTLVAYSDGISEAMSTKGEEFGEERLHEVLKSCAMLRAGDIIGRVLEAVGDWSREAPQHDDMTILALRLK